MKRLACILAGAVLVGACAAEAPVEEPTVTRADSVGVAEMAFDPTAPTPEPPTRGFPVKGGARVELLESGVRWPRRKRSAS